MDIIRVLATLLLIAALIFAIVKKYNIVTSLLIISFFALLAMTIINGTSVLGKSTYGSNFLDIFEYIANNFISRTSSTGMLLMSVMGFAMYMNHVKASTMMATLAAKPLTKLNKPYLIVSIAFLLGIFLHLFVPSHVAFATLLMLAFYPVFISVGVSKKTAISVVLLAGMVDMGPADPITNFIISSKLVDMDVTEFFLVKQLPVVAIVVAVTAVLIFFVSKYADKKEGFVFDKNQKIDVDTLKGVPKWYAILPTIPLLLVMIFSKLFVGTITISVIAANIIGFAVTFIAEMITKKSIKKVLNETQTFYDGMGNSFANAVGLIILAGVFASCIEMTGGLNVITNMLVKSGAGGFVIAIFSGLIGFVTVAVTGSAVATCTSFIPLLPGITSAMNVSFLSAALPMEIGASIARCICPVAAAVIVACKMGDIEIMDIVKRNFIPTVASFVVLVILSYIML